jgi:hypothetical protein
MTEDMKEQQRMLGLKMAEPDYLSLPKSILSGAVIPPAVKLSWWQRLWAVLMRWVW